jgi:hypothetical protein
MSLVALDDLKTYLGIDLIDTSQDAFLNGEIALFDETVQNYCNRIFEVNTYTETIYYDDFKDDFEYTLYHHPVSLITSVTEKAPDAPDELQTFRLNKRTGNLVLTNDSGVKKRLFSNYSTGAYLEIIYDAGYATVPLEIQEAVKALIQQRYNRKNAGIDLNFGNNVQRISIPGVMGIDFDYTLNSNERQNKYGMLLGDYLNVFDNYRSERTIVGDNTKVYLG